MANKVRLTEKVLADLKAPETGELVLHDAKLAGFGVRVRATGAKTFMVRYRLKGGRRGAVRRYSIGAVGTMPLESARTAAQRILALAKLGKDPAGEKADKRAEWTVADLCEAYFKAGANGNKPGTIWRDQGRVRRHIVPLMGRRPVSEITPADIERLRVAIAEGKTACDVRTGPRGRARVTGGDGAARRVVGLLGSIFSFATREGLRADNPARGIRRGRDGKRERFLTGEELERLGDALREFEAKGGNPKGLTIIRLLILTGARRSEIAALKWHEVNFDQGILALGASKTGPKAIILPAPAIVLLTELAHTRDSEYVFPAAGGASHYQGLGKVWRAVRMAAGLSDVRNHDLRHSFASAALSRGASLPVIGKLLGHSSPAVTARYAHIASDPLRQAADATAASIAAAMDRKSTATVVPIRRGA